MLYHRFSFFLQGLDGLEGLSGLPGDPGRSMSGVKGDRGFQGQVGEDTFIPAFLEAVPGHKGPPVSRIMSNNHLTSVHTSQPNGHRIQFNVESTLNQH